VNCEKVRCCSGNLSTEEQYNSSDLGIRYQKDTKDTESNQFVNGRREAWAREVGRRGMMLNKF
jgi:hypothetical protein